MCGFSVKLVPVMEIFKKSMYSIANDMGKPDHCM